MLILIWIGLSFLVATSGSDKKIGYWGVFFLSLILSPLIGLIIGLASGEEVKKKANVWKCGACGFGVFNLAKTCPNCNIVIDYPLSVYDSVKYTCNDCKKKFFGKKPNCPHCSTVNSW